jgi:hypothetical protein
VLLQDPLGSLRRFFNEIQKDPGSSVGRIPFDPVGYSPHNLLITTQELLI